MSKGLVKLSLNPCFDGKLEKSEPSFSIISKPRSIYMYRGLLRVIEGRLPPPNKLNHSCRPHCWLTHPLLVLVVQTLQRQQRLSMMQWSPHLPLVLIPMPPAQRGLNSWQKHPSLGRQSHLTVSSTSLLLLYSWPSSWPKVSKERISK